jgi:hypothetical protein
MGKETQYQIHDPESVSDLLIVYRKSFLDTSVDRFVKLWLELNPDAMRKSRKKKEHV